MGYSRGTTELIAMLETRRPGRTKSECRWIREWLEPLGVEQDSFGNLYKRVGDSAVLFSSHTDTVHRKGGQQRVTIDKAGIIRVADKGSNCLGADCTTGVWLMREMILAGIPGLYVFHRDEESGGKGSSYIAAHHPELLDGIRYAVAFDRYGRQDVITHQFGKCASSEFASALSDELNAYGKGFAYTPSPNGVFTDSANYAHLIPECTNIAVGYMGHHTYQESQDTDHAMRLRDALMYVPWETLPCVRDVRDDDWRTGLWDDLESNVRPAADLESMIRDYPEAVVELLESYGLDEADLADIIYTRHGVVRCA